MAWDNLVNYSKDQDNVILDYGTARQGCNDAFSVFGFLAFLLALLQLIMDMQVLGFHEVLSIFIKQHVM